MWNRILHGKAPSTSTWSEQGRQQQIFREDKRQVVTINEFARGLDQSLMRRMDNDLPISSSYS